MKEFKEIISKGDFFNQEDGELSESLLIQRKETDSDFEIFKAGRFEKVVTSG